MSDRPVWEMTVTFRLECDIEQATAVAAEAGLLVLGKPPVKVEFKRVGTWTYAAYPTGDDLPDPTIGVIR